MFPSERAASAALSLYAKSSMASCLEHLFEKQTQQDPDLRNLHVDSDAVEYVPGQPVRVAVRLLGRDYQPLPNGKVAIVVKRGADPTKASEVSKADITVGEDGCAHDIKIVRPLGYGLDEASVFAVRRWRFRQGFKSARVNVEFNFDPRYSTRVPPTTPACEDAVRRSTGY